jgi:hypothetical protein
LRQFFWKSSFQLFSGLSLREIRITLLLGFDQLTIRNAQFLHDRVLLDIHGNIVPVLSILNNENHEERDDRGAGIYDELPRVRKSKNRPAQAPKKQKHQRNNENPGPAQPRRDSACKLREYVV